MVSESVYDDGRDGCCCAWGAGERGMARAAGWRIEGGDGGSRIETARSSQMQ